MILIPDYNKKPVCHYCGKRHAEEEYVYVLPKRYFIEKDEVLIAIPRCKRCFKDHMPIKTRNCSILKSMTFFIMSSAIIFPLIFFGAIDYLESYLGDGFIRFIPIIILCLALYYAHEWLYFKIRGVKKEKDVNDYAPIAKMEANSSHSATDKNSNYINSDINKIIDDIINKDNCNIYQEENQPNDEE